MRRAWTPIRVFVSSTFRDMQAERDTLVKVVFPALRERLEEHRVTLSDVDLRWGVTREQAESDQALGLCLEQIDQCRPFFIGMLGERYGWTPPLIPAAVRARYSWPTEMEGRSITEFEMRHALASGSDRQGAIFLLRDPQCASEIPEGFRADYVEPDADHIRRLAALKAAIRASGCPVLEGYGCRWDATAFDPLRREPGRLALLDGFAEFAQKQLWEAIAHRLELPASRLVAGVTAEGAVEQETLEAESEAHDRFLESRLRVFVGRDRIHARLREYVSGAGDGPLAVTGPPGCGKSAILARLFRDCRDEPGVAVAHFVGASAASGSLRLTLRRFCQTLVNRFGFAGEVPDDVNRLITYFHDALARVPQGTCALIVLDAVNQFDDTDRAHDLKWLPASLPPGVRIVFSCADEPGSRALDRLRRRGVAELRVDPLTLRERLGIIRRVPSLWAKALDRAERRLLLENPETANPLYLLVALEELRGFGSFEQLRDRISAFPRGGEALTAVFNQVLERLESDFHTELVAQMLKLLGSARRGLSERELLSALGGKVDSGDVYVVLRQIRPYLARRANLMDFFHGGLTKAVVQRYFGTPGERTAGHAQIADFFAAQPDRLEAPLGAPNARKADEIPWQRLQAEQWDELARVLTDLSFLETKTAAGMTHDLLADYAAALHGLPFDHPRGRLLRLVNEALRMNSGFIARHPAALLQAIWNTAWWYDSPEAEPHYEPVEGETPPWTYPGEKLYTLMEKWRREKQEREPGFLWLRSLRPPFAAIEGGADLIVRDHTDRIFSVVFTVDGRQVVTASRDRTVRVFDAADGSEVTRCMGHEHAVNCVACSVSGDRIVSGSDDGTIRCWNAFTGDEIWRVGDLDKIPEFALASSMNYTSAVIMRALAVLGANIPWSVGRRETRVTSVAFAPRADRVAAAVGGNLLLLDAETGELLRHAWWNAVLVDSIAYSGNGALAAGISDGTVRLLDPETLEELAQLEGHETFNGGLGVTGLAFSPAGDRLAAGDWKGGVRIWDPAAGKVIRVLADGATIQGLDSGITGLAFSLDGRWLVTATAKAGVRVLDPEDGSERLRLNDHSGWVRGVACSGADARVATCADDRTLRIFAPFDKSPALRLKRHSGVVGRIVYSRDGSALASATTDGEVIVWGTETFLPKLKFRERGRVGGLWFSPDGSRLAWASSLSEVHIRDARDGRELLQIDGAGRADPTFLRYSSTGAMLASGSYNHVILVQNAETGKAILCVEGYQTGLTALSLAPGRIISGSRTGQISVWNAQTGGLVRHLEGHGGPLTYCLALPATGRIASAAEDKALLVWNIGTGERILSVTGLTAAAHSLACSSDEKVLFAPNGNVVQGWEIHSGARLFSLDHGEHISRIVTVPAVAPSPATAAASDVGDATGLVSSYTGRIAVVGGCRLTLWSDTGEQLARFNVCPEKSAVLNLAVDPGGRYFVLATNEYALRMWDVEAGQELWKVDLADLASSLAVSPDSESLAIGLYSGLLLVWFPREQKTVRLEGHSSEITGLEYASAGELVSASADGTIKSWNPATGERLHEIAGPTDLPLDVPFTIPYGRKLAGERGPSGELLDEVSGAVLMRVRNLADQQMGLPFSPDDRYLACASTEHELLVLDLEKRLVGFRLPGHRGLINAIAFSDDGRRIATGSRERTVRLWDAGSGAHLKDYNGRGDVQAISTGPPQYPWFALVRDATETVIVSSQTGAEVAWFPAPMLPIVTHPSGRMWCGVEYTDQYFFRLEGAPDPSQNRSDYLADANHAAVLRDVENLHKRNPRT